MPSPLTQSSGHIGAAARGAPSMPKVWVLTSNKPGDDNQSRLLAEALGFPFVAKRMVFGHAPRLPVLDNLLGPSLTALDRPRSDPLEPPWPDLVITAGRRQESVSRWIKRRSGGRTKIVHFNRPKVVTEFDLVVVPPQLDVPKRPNVLHIRLPLNRPEKERAEAAPASHFGDRPRPWLLGMIGGPAWPFVVDAETGRAFMTALQRYSDAAGGSLFVTTSPRTPPDAVAALRAAARPRDYLYQWAPDRTDNPFQALLETCDAFVVTCDSVAMPTQVIRLRKPLAIYRLPQRRHWRKTLKIVLHRLLRRDTQSAFGAFVSDAASWFGLGFTRDLVAFHDSIVERGWASYFGDGIEPPSRPPPDDLKAVADRVRSLLLTGLN